VQTAHWDSVTGYLQRYEWRDNNWVEVGKYIPINVGKNGMHWGKGLKNYGVAFPAMAKHEGDGRSPAGIFPLVSAFGYAHPDSLKGLRFPYDHVDAFTQCIEDVASAHYNRIINGKQTVADWNSTDFMLRKDDLYEWGIFVGHNYGTSTQGGDGSCIFMHAWRKAGKGTAGCTAMEKSNMKEIVFWLDESKNPLLLQVPESGYSTFSKQFILPKQKELPANRR
jgi:D-alanyl-D-alanine dipeptidase